MLSKIDQSKAPVKTGSIYPEPYAALMAGRRSLRLGDAGAAKSSLRHWHLHEDEFVMILEGECTLIQDAGETLMQVGDCAAFPAGNPDGHCFVNTTAAEARFLVVGTKAPREVATYSDIDLMVTIEGKRAVFTHKDGSAYAAPAHSHPALAPTGAADPSLKQGSDK